MSLDLAVVSGFGIKPDFGIIEVFDILFQIWFSMLKKRCVCGVFFSSKKDFISIFFRSVYCALLTCFFEFDSVLDTVEKLYIFSFFFFFEGMPFLHNNVLSLYVYDVRIL